jgi:hypothetical protein
MHTITQEKDDSVYLMASKVTIPAATLSSPNRSPPGLST